MALISSALNAANSTERTVVEMRHIDCRGWDKIAEALYMSRSNVFNYYNSRVLLMYTVYSIQVQYY